MGGQPELDELVEHFTLLPDDVALLRNKSGAPQPANRQAWPGGVGRRGRVVQAQGSPRNHRLGSAPACGCTTSRGCPTSIPRWTLPWAASPRTASVAGASRWAAATDAVLGLAAQGNVHRGIDVGHPREVVHPQAGADPSRWFRGLPWAWTTRPRRPTPPGHAWRLAGWGAPDLLRSKATSSGNSVKCSTCL